VVLLALVGCGGAPRVELTFTSAEIQERVSAKFPIEHTTMATRLRLDQPLVLLRPGSDDIGLKMNLYVDPPLVGPREGTVTIGASLRYEPEQSAFFLQNPQVEAFEVEGVKPGIRDAITKAALPVLRKVLDRTPVYRLKGRNLKEAAAARVLESVAVHDGTVVATLRVRD
jgi:hypothetical protein